MNRVAAYVGHERDAQTDGWENIVTWQTLLSADRTPTTALTIGTAEIAPAAPVEGAIHQHADHEAYYFLRGVGAVHIDGVDHRVEPGSIVFVPGDARHFVRNTGDEPLKFVYVFGVDQFGDVEYRFAD